MLHQRHISFYRQHIEHTYLAGAVGLEGAQHRGGFKEKLPNAEGGEVLVPLVQSHLYGVLQALCESE